MTGKPLGSTALTRRGFLAASVLGGAALVACSRSTTATAPNGSGPAIPSPQPKPPAPHRKDRHRTLGPGPADIDLGGTRAQTLAYNNAVPGPMIRANVGDDIAVTVDNGLDHPTSMHWHGLAVRNDMDGAAPATPNVDPGKSFHLPVQLAPPGTYWAHPHRAGHRLRPVRAGHHRRPGRTRPLRRRVDRHARRLDLRSRAAAPNRSSTA